MFLDIVVVMLKARSPVTLWARGLIRREVSFFQDYKDHFHCVSLLLPVEEYMGYGLEVCSGLLFSDILGVYTMRKAKSPSNLSRGLSRRKRVQRRLSLCFLYSCL